MSLKIGIIIASIREGRNGEVVANWVLEQALKRADGNTYQLVDLKSYDLPFLGRTPNESQLNAITKWSSDMASFDGYVLVTPEYNHGVPGTLANAFQFLKAEVQNKALGFVGYGFLGAARAIFGYRSQLVYQQIAIVQQQLNLSLNLDFKNVDGKMVFAPGDYHIAEINTLLNQLTSWSGALKSIRA